MNRAVIILLALITSIVAIAPPVFAQSGDVTPTPAGPPQEETDIPRVHIVQEGETLFGIATQYDTTVETLLLLNSIDDAALIQVGQELIIPGGGGESVAAVHIVQLGDTLPGIAAGYNTSVESVAQANRLINPNYLVAGQPITIVSRTGSADPSPLGGDPHVVRPGDTLLTVAAENNLPPAAIVQANDLAFPTYLYAGQRLRLAGEGQYQILPDPWSRIQMLPVQPLQGDSVSFYVETLLPGQPGGQLGSQALRFVPWEDGYIALAGIDAFTEPGRYKLELTGQGDQPWQPYERDVQITSAGFGTQFITIPENLAYLLAPEIRAEEDAFLATVYSDFSDTAMWRDQFQEPLTNTLITARYGDGRSYNDGPVDIYHTGIDYAGVVGTPIHSPAAGTVVFSDTLQLRGNTLIIDHGLGIMTGYYHLSNISVEVGERIEKGHLIAEGGSTGLSNGPHLHWDMRVNNIPINGLQWTGEDFPFAIPP
jgi:murein DD-endopeptidase MepM/ murein hydrolase activator NlpD